MATTAHGHEEVAVACILDGGDDIGNIGTPHDETGIAVNHAIINFASRLVAGIVSLQQLTAYTRLECLKRCMGRHGILHNARGTVVLALCRDALLQGLCPLLPGRYLASHDAS